MACCTIYLLKNTANSKVYVGQTWSSLEERWNNGHGYDGSRHLSYAIKKYGREKFYYEILGLASSQAVADY
jgi:dissimilatory sulfite reductase (desulfoviridin) alpha/beta subunit